MKAFVVPSIFTAIDKFSGPVQKMSDHAHKFQAEMARLERGWRNVGNSAMTVGRQSLIMSASLIAPLVIMTKKAIEFEDKMADVGKTTGLQGEALERFGDAILEMSTKTRTSINDLVKIGEIGGQLGVTSDQLLAFTDSANKFNVALGADFSGGVEQAITSVGNIKALFAQTRDLDISEVIKRSGSAINELGAVGSGTSENITDFVLRLGALPDALKPSVQDTMALATALEEMGIKSEIGARGIGDVITTAGSNIEAFARQMKLSSAEASQLLSSDSTEFMKRFAKSFEGMDTVSLSEKLKELKIGDTGTIKVIGALASGTERLTQLQLISNKAFEEGTSLQSEYQKKNSTAAAKWEILKNNIHAAAITLGQAFLPIILEVMQTVTPLIQKFGKWAKENKQFLGTIMKVVAGLGAFSGVISVLSFGLGGFAKAMAFVIKTMAWYQGGTKMAMMATKLFSTQLMGIPLMWVIAGVAALAVGIYQLVKAWNSSTAAERVNSELQERVLDQTADQRVEIMLLTNTLRTHNQTSAAYLDALAKLEEISPGIVSQFNLQEKSIKAISAAERQLTTDILKRAEAEVRAEMLKEKMKEKMELGQEKIQVDWMDMLTGGNLATSEMNRLGQMNKLDEEINVLAAGSTQDQMQEINPGWEKQMALTNSGDAYKKSQNITIDFKNLPPGVNVTNTGDNIGKVGSGVTTSSTR